MKNSSSNFFAILLSFGAMICFGFPALAQQTQESVDAAERRKLFDVVREAFLVGQYDVLKKAYDELKAGDGRTSIGMPKLVWFGEAVRNAIRRDSRAPGEQILKRSVERAKHWASQEPASVLAHVIFSQTQVELAFHYRGNGFSNTVPPMAWALFESLCVEAHQALLKVEHQGQSDPGWLAQMIWVGTLLGWQSERVGELLDASIAANPRDERAYRAAITYFSPRWLGNAALLDQVINRVVQSVGAAEGEELYVRLYNAAVRQDFHHRAYADSMIDWGRMASGFERLLVRSNGVWVLNTYAYHACIAQDKIKFKSLVAMPTWKPDVELWNPNGAVTLETCRAWAG